MSGSPLVGPPLLLSALRVQDLPRVPTTQSVDELNRFIASLLPSPREGAFVQGLGTVWQVRFDPLQATRFDRMLGGYWTAWNPNMTDFRVVVVRKKGMQVEYVRLSQSMDYDHGFTIEDLLMPGDAARILQAIIDARKILFDHLEGKDARYVTTR